MKTFIVTLLAAFIMSTVPVFAGEVIVIAHIKIAKNVKKFESALKKVTYKIRKSPGSIKYNVFKSGGKENVYYFFEIWENQEAHGKHIKAPHTQAFIQEVMPLFAAPPQVSVVQEIMH